MCHSYLHHTLRLQLLTVALEWERHFSVLPRIGDAISEFDAAMLVGHTPATFSTVMTGTTAVQKGFDFRLESVRYQVKHNRPSGKKGSKVTNAGEVTKSFDWDVLIYLLYNERFDIQGAWFWDVQAYRDVFENRPMKKIKLADIQKGKALL